MPTDYIKTADLHAALARVRDETKAKVWAEAYAAGQKAEQEQYAKAVQLVTLGRALGGFPVNPQVVVTQPITPDPVEEIIREAKAFTENPDLPRRENPDGPAYGKLLQLTEGWVHPDGAVTPLTHPGEAHIAALAEADPDVKKEFHAAIARHAHRKHPADFVDDDVKDYAFDKGFIHLTSGSRKIEATGKHEMLLKHRKFLKELAMRATTLVFRPVDGDDYEVKAKREGKAIPANPRHRTADVLGTHAVVQDALSRGDTQYANRQREIHADALDDAGAVREAALERVLAGQQPASHLAATFKNAANLKRAARSRTEAAHEASAEAYQRSLHHGEPDDNGFPRPHSRHVEAAWDWSYQGRFYAQTGQHLTAGNYQSQTAKYHGAAGAHYAELASTHPDQPEFAELAALHRHVAEQHRIAAAYNAAAHYADSQRTVKAIRWNDRKAEHQEPDKVAAGAYPGEYAGDYSEDDADPNPVHAAYHRSNALLDKSGDGHGDDTGGIITKLTDRYPHLNPRQVNENMLDAADLGDEAGHRYWKRRLGDVHLMLAGEAATAGDHDLSAEHDEFAAHLRGRGFASILDEEQEAAAHLIAHHKGDVAAAARHASEAAIKATDPELVKNVATKGPTNSNVSGPHYDAYHYHLDAVRSISHAPDTYRPLTLHDIDRHEAGEFVQFFRKPRTPGESPHMRTFSVGKVRRGSSPNEFHLPAYSGQAITHENMHDVETIDTDAHQHRLDLQQMHEVAALLHQEASTGDHEKREIKAERKAFAPGIEAEPGAAGRTLHPPEDSGMGHAWDTEGALHAAMVKYPHDTTPRMVLADYYDDHDQPHTAALHRFVAEPTRTNFDMLAAFHEHPSEVAHTVEHAAAMHADATIPRWVAVDRGVDYEDERRHPATGAIPPTGLRNELNNVIHRNAYHPSVQRFPADSPSHTERRLTRDLLMWHHRRYGEEQAAYAAAHADPSTVADWGPDPISEQGHAFARTLHHAAAEAHRHARDYLTEQDALDKPERNDGPIPEGVWRHPRLGREGKAFTNDPAPHGYCPECKVVNSDEKTCPTCGPFDKNPKYSYAGVELTGEMADYLHSAGAMIPDADLAKDGRETNPHVTVRYGLHENDGAGTHEMLTGAGPVTVRFVPEVAMFSNKDADVIHVPVQSEDLHRLNGMLAALPHTDTHAGYKPHATIAYVRPGLGAKYIKELPAPPAARDTVSTVTFSNPARKTRIINLETP